MKPKHRGPFLSRNLLVSFAGFFCVPLFHVLKIHQILRVEGPDIHLYKKGTATMGGLFLIPVGIIVAGAASVFSSVEVFQAAAATIAATGLLDDSLSLMKKHNYGLPAWIKIILEVSAGTSFSFWLNSTDIASPYDMHSHGILMLVSLPLSQAAAYKNICFLCRHHWAFLCIGRLYLLLTTFCFVPLANEVNLTGGLDGLAGGVAALTFLGMSIAVLPICSGRKLLRMAPVHHHFELSGFKEPTIVATAYVV